MNDDLFYKMPPCPSCADVGQTLAPLLAGDMTICRCDRVVVMQDNSTLRLATEAESASPEAARKRRMHDAVAKFIDEDLKREGSDGAKFLKLLLMVFRAGDEQKAEGHRAN